MVLKSGFYSVSESLRFSIESVFDIQSTKTRTEEVWFVYTGGKEGGVEKGLA